MIEINNQLAIDEGELTFLASRSGGPGGQNVNKVASRVTLRFDLEASPSLTAEQRVKIRERLPTRITKEGVLFLHVQKHRSQGKNRELAVERFAALLADALSEAPPRRPTRVPRGVRERRLENKKRRARIKKERRRRWAPES